MKTLITCLSIAGFALNLCAADVANLPTARGQANLDPDAERIVLPPSAVFSESVRKLVVKVKSGESSDALEQLKALDKKLSTDDPHHWRALLFEGLRYLDPSVIGVFEDSLVARYTELMVVPGKLAEMDREELEMIAVVGRSMMSVKLAKLFFRDFTKVEPYVFKAPLERGGWRPSDVDDWKGLQGRMVAASIACDDSALLQDWIARAEHSKGSVRLLIWWALGYSLREESVNYLLEQHSKQLEPSEKMIVEYALSFAANRVASYSKDLEKYEKTQFGVLTPEEVKALRVRLQRLAPHLQQGLLKVDGISDKSPVMLYRD